MNVLATGAGQARAWRSQEATRRAQARCRRCANGIQHGNCQRQRRRQANPCRNCCGEVGLCRNPWERAGARLNHTTAISKTDAATLTGTVKWFNGERGFILIDGEYRDIFCHVSQVVDQGHELSKGERVMFVEDVGRDGRSYARRIELVKET